MIASVSEWEYRKEAIRCFFVIRFRTRKNNSLSVLRPVQHRTIAGLGQLVATGATGGKVTKNLWSVSTHSLPCLAEARPWLCIQVFHAPKKAVAQGWGSGRAESESSSRAPFERSRFAERKSSKGRVGGGWKDSEYFKSWRKRVYKIARSIHNNLFWGKMNTAGRYICFLCFFFSHHLFTVWKMLFSCFFTPFCTEQEPTSSPKPSLVFLPPFDPIRWIIARFWE